MSVFFIGYFGKTVASHCKISGFMLKQRQLQAQIGANSVKFFIVSCFLDPSLTYFHSKGVWDVCVSIHNFTGIHFLSTLYLNQEGYMNVQKIKGVL